MFAFFAVRKPPVRRCSSFEGVQSASALASLEQVRQSHLVIVPTSRLYEVWEGILFFALTYVLFMSPFETAFIQGPVRNGRFELNRIVDVLFLFQMLLSFFVSYKTPSKRFQRLKWELNIGNIAKRYLATTFLPDLLYYTSSAVDIVRETDIYHAAARRNRHIKLIRLLHATVQVKLWAHREKFDIFIQKQLDYWHVPHGVAIFGRGLIGLFVAAHYMACIWGLTGLLGDQQGDASYVTWIRATCTSKGVQMSSLDPGSLYALSLYWAMVTLTTTGYGDVVAMNTAEYIVCNILILAGAAAWSRFFGIIFSAVGGDDYGVALHDNLDTIQNVSRAHKLSRDLKARMRAHVVREDNAKGQSVWIKAQALMSPALQEEIKVEVFEPRLRAFPHLAAGTTTLLQMLTRSLRMSSFAPSEWVLPADLLPFLTVDSVAEEIKGDKARGFEPTLTGIGTLSTPKALPLMLLQDGLVTRRLHVGWSCWHEDFLLAWPKLQDPVVARAIRFSSTYALTRGDLMDALLSSGDLSTATAVRIAAAKLAMKRAVKIAFTEECSAPLLRSLLKQPVPPGIASSDEPPNLHIARMSSKISHLFAQNAKLGQQMEEIIALLKGKGEKALMGQPSPTDTWDVPAQPCLDCTASDSRPRKWLPAATLEIESP